MTRPPRWAAVLLAALASRGDADDVLGDLQEAHRNRRQRHGPLAARILLTLEILEMAVALVRGRASRLHISKGNGIVHDYKLALRMLLKYPGLTIAGGLALAIAIGVGAAWFDLAGGLFRPKLPLPEGDRIVEVEMRNAAGGDDERRIAHDFGLWREHGRLLEDLGAYRSLERNLVIGDSRPEPITVAEITASAFRVARIAPLAGRALLDADEQPGGPPVVVLGYGVWQQWFGGRRDIIGQRVQLGRTSTTVVGVMPEGFAFPVNHRVWVPLRIPAAGYAPLQGPPVRVFGRLSPGATQAQAYAEVTALTQRVVTASPQTHEHLRPRVLAYGGESPGDRSWLEFAITHLPILLVLLVACVNVGTLIYARTATRDAEIAIRYALGASRRRIVMQLFVEALVLASIAALAGLTAAHLALKWGIAAYYSGQTGGLPFWIEPGLKLETVVYAVLLTIAGAAILGLLPALKVTGRKVQRHLKNLGAGGSTLRFGGVWTTAMVAQVALTVVCLPPAFGISSEALRDRRIREQFPAEQFLAARIALDREAAATRGGEETPAAHAARLAQLYAELERRLLAEGGVRAVTFGDRLPGMSPAVRGAEVEVTSGAQPVAISNLWSTSVGPGFFEAFEVPLTAGRDFHEGDRAPGANTVLVNEAFARRYLAGTNPVGRRVRYTASSGGSAEPWFEIVGMVRDVGMTPTDLGEAPYIFRAVSPDTAAPLVVAVRTSGDPGALAPRLRSIAANLDAGLRLDEVRSLEDFVWRVDAPNMVAAGALAFVVALGLFLSAAGIFSLMSVNVARRTKEIGLRAALGASQGRLLTGIFSRALVLVGSGVAAGNLLLVFFISLEPEVDVTDVYGALVMTSAVMLTVGLLACIEPARRALRIHPTDALKEA